MTITATKVGDLKGFRGHAALYRLSVPVTDAHGAKTSHVVVSAAEVPFSGPETYIFPADADGKVTNWLEMDGSFKGALDHERALRQAGWSVLPTPDPTP